jgi:hypothetical protein
MTKTNALQGTLAELGKSAKRGKKSAPAPVEAARRRTTRGMSISVYPADEDRIKEIQHALLAHGVHVSDSEAIRLHLRSAPIEVPKLLAARELMASEDQRRRPR